MMEDFISNDNFEGIAGQYYNNIVFDSEEFLEDLGRIKYVKRLLNKYHQSGELKERLIINHLVILYNVFDPIVLTKMLFFKFEKYHHYLKPFLIFMGRLPDQIDYYTKSSPVLYTSDIESDENIEQELRKHLRPANG